MTFVCFYKEINDLLHRNSYFLPNSVKTMTSFFSEISKMENREDNCHQDILVNFKSFLKTVASRHAIFLKLKSAHILNLYSEFGSDFSCAFHLIELQ